MVIKDGNLLYDLEIHFTRLTKLTKWSNEKLNSSSN